jgi:hypothetical protein
LDIKNTVQRDRNQKKSTAQTPDHDPGSVGCILRHTPPKRG